MTRSAPGQERTGSVLVVGSGIGGMQSALDLANSGLLVHMINDEPSIGGTMSRLDKTFPTGDCATCIVSPKLVECARNLNVTIEGYGYAYHAAFWVKNIPIFYSPWIGFSHKKTGIRNS